MIVFILIGAYISYVIISLLYYKLSESRNKALKEEQFNIELCRLLERMQSIDIPSMHSDLASIKLIFGRLITSSGACLNQCPRCGGPIRPRKYNYDVIPGHIHMSCIDKNCQGFVDVDLNSVMLQELKTQ